MKQGIPLHVVAADINNAQKIFLISSGGAVAANRNIQVSMKERNVLYCIRTFSNANSYDQAMGKRRR